MDIQREKFNNISDNWITVSSFWFLIKKLHSHITVMYLIFSVNFIFWTMGRDDNRGHSAQSVGVTALGDDNECWDELHWCNDAIIISHYISHRRTREIMDSSKPKCAYALGNLLVTEDTSVILKIGLEDIDTTPLKQ